MGKKFSKPELSRKINGDIPFDTPKTEKPDDHKIRFDVALANRFPRYSRSTIQKFIKEGYARYDNQLEIHPRALIDEDAELTLELPETENEETDKPKEETTAENTVADN